MLMRHKLFIASYVLLVTILIALLTLTYNIERRYTFHGDTLRVTQVTSMRLNYALIGDSIVEMVDSDGNVLTMTRTGNDRQTNVLSEYRIEYMDKVITRTMINDAEEGRFRRYIFSDGAEFIVPLFSGSVHPGTTIPDRYRLRLETDLHLEEEALRRWLSGFLHTYEPASSSVRLALICMGGWILSLILVFYPETAWKIQTFMSVEGGKPTEFALFLNRAIGVGVTVLLLGLIAAMFFSVW